MRRRRSDVISNWGKWRMMRSKEVEKDDMEGGEGEALPKKA